MKETSKVVVLITTATEEEAHSITELVLNQRKAAERTLAQKEKEA